ncbi:NPCBM/NEW2 domain-containing protein [Nocardioides sp. B-3]|uniref:NPCBM/NEW2 domain-containing protein n=1 Tax=Nocardioides sp. B-3 TaxID=2895565 RepID=UPI0021533086|nr:NPCBM/NEW2 domain-containing protein [Nocardioides sp. B-3]UUZ61476.1 NPCBM/NEW2 domain-containing protein [Nocardioides sp. B-3]
MSLFSRVSMLSGVVVVAATLTPVTASSGVEPAPLNGEVWASDLPFVSEVNGWGPAQRDRSNGEQGATDGRTIWVDGKSHTKGIGVHADSAIRFDVGGDCEFFRAEVGIDDEVGTRGSVVFAVVADGLRSRRRRP